MIVYIIPEVFKGLGVSLDIESQDLTAAFVKNFIKPD
jgi:hypothetical protein